MAFSIGRRIPILAIVSLTVAIATRSSRADAQANFSTQFSIGLSQSHASEGFLADVMMSYRAPFRGGLWLAGLTAAHEGILGPQLCTSTCVTFNGFAAQVGLERAISFITVEASIGPGLYRFSNSARATGTQGRIEVALPATTAAALVLASRHTWWSNSAPAEESTAFLIGIRSRGFFNR